MQLKFVIGIFMPFFFAAAAFGASAPPRIRVATWNVENLFDADDDPANVGDDEFTIGEWRKWSDDRYQRKLAHIAELIIAMKPDIICMQEVENRQVVEDLAKLISKHPDMKSFTNIVHYESSDTRGIDIAMISRFPVISSKLNNKSKIRRGFLAADFDTGSGTSLVLIGCHLKSCWGKAAANEKARYSETRELREIVNTILKKQPNSSMVVLGDFNENADGPSMVKGLCASTNLTFTVSSEGKKKNFLYNVLGEIKSSEQGSYYYLPKKTWNTFDSIIITPEMTRPILEKGPAWRLAAKINGKPNATVFKFPDAVWPGRDGRPKPFRRSHDGSGKKPYVEGYSDHFPIYVELTRGQQN